MISRTWHGIVSIHMKDAFEKYEYETGIRDTTIIKGNMGAYLKIVEQGEYAHFFLCTKWDTMADALSVNLPITTTRIYCISCSALTLSC